MILFASGRTDIPAFYAPWFMRRLREGFVDVRNPYDQTQVTRYEITTNKVDCIVFCSKNPEPMLQYLAELRRIGLGIYFFVTITPYEEDIESNVVPVSHVVKVFHKLSDQLGRQCVCWRYDPILVNEHYTIDFHKDAFAAICSKIEGATDRCIISFIDLYRKTIRQLPHAREVTEQEQCEIATSLSKIAAQHHIKIESCAEKCDLSSYGVARGACVTRCIIEEAIGHPLLERGIGIQTLRSHCNCLPMRDIGAYNSCPHLCRYCYANDDPRLVRANIATHSPFSTMLLGELQPGDHLHLADQKSYRDHELRLFDEIGGFLC